MNVQWRESLLACRVCWFCALHKILLCDVNCEERAWLQIDSAHFQNPQLHELFTRGTEFRLKTFPVDHSFFLSMTELLCVWYIAYLTHCHTILPTNWLLGNMAHWMGCIFISLHSELQTLRRGKHPYCSLLPSVHSIHKGFALFGTSSNFSSCMYLIEHPWGLKESHWRQLRKWCSVVSV